MLLIGNVSPIAGSDFLPAVFSVTDGPAEGQPFYPLTWHTFVVGSLFGWHLSSGRWRFRSAWLETGKGQAKSPLMGALGVYIMGYCSIPRAQVFAIGQDKATANVLFRDAVAMCRGQIPDEEPGDTLEARGEVIIRGEGDNAWKIEHPDSGSFFRTLAGGDAQSGPRPACVLADEIHEFKSDQAIETWKRAIDKIAGNAMMILGTNTPARSQHVGNSYSEVYQQIAKGEKRDDSAFSFVARIDKADRDTVFENERCWGKPSACAAPSGLQCSPRRGPSRRSRRWRSAAARTNSPATRSPRTVASAQAVVGSASARNLFFNGLQVRSGTRLLLRLASDLPAGVAFAW